MRRFLSIWLPIWPTDRWRQQRPDVGAGDALALTLRGQGGVRLVAVDDVAASAGLAPGMGLADARALVPGLIAAEADPEKDAAALAALADWCGRYSPWCATDGADGIRLDIAGCAHLFGGEAALLADLKARLARQGFAARLAVANTPAAAWAWAHYRPRDAGAVLPAGNTKPLLALPVAALRLEEETATALARLGLRSVGTVAALPRAPLARRLGASVLRRLDRLLGRAAEPISPRALAVHRVARLIFAEPVGRREDIDDALSRLLAHLCRDLALEGQGARRLDLVFYRVDATVQRLAIGTSGPTHDTGHLARLFVERLDSVDPGFGIEAMVLEVVEAEALAPRQTSLATAGEADAGDLARLIDRLQNRLGKGRVVQLIPVESHAPERAERRVPVLSSNSRHANRLRKVRPIKLLHPPEPIEAMAPIPDDPPLSFRWRRAVHRVAQADGPERIGPEWWQSGPGRPRDYYRVEDSEGRRFWLYREGLYGAQEPPRWFMHGFFP